MQSLAIAETLDAPSFTAKVHNLLGDIEYRCDRLDDADRLLSRALSMATEAQSPHEAATALYTLGCVAEDRGDHRQKVLRWTRALEQARAAEDHEMAANIEQLLH